ncbi:hypothetical protein N5C39_24580, partial [Enterobacter bugandensis]
MDKISRLVYFNTRKCMEKLINVMFGLLDFRRNLLIALLALVSCQTVLAANHLLAVCDGPEGYCSEGSQVTVTYLSGGEVKLPAMPNSGSQGGAPSIQLGYCPTSGNGMAASGCRYLNQGNISAEKLKQGGWEWSEYISIFTGKYRIPVGGTSSNTQYCIAAWVATHDSNPSGAAWLSFGESTIYSGTETPCVGNAPPPP